MTTTDRGLRRAIIALAIPVSLEAILQMSLGFIDQVVVGRLGVSALAAAGLTNNMMSLMTLVVAAIAASASILVAQHHGRGDSEGVARVTGCAVVSALVVSVPPTIVTALFPGEALHLLGAEPDVVEHGRRFFQIMAFTLPLSLLSAVAIGVMRSLGDSRTPMFITMAAVVSNTVLSLVLVFGLGSIPAFGVAGAAAATLISHVLRLGLLSYVLRARLQASSFPLSRFTGFGKQVVKALLAMAYPIMLTDVLWGIGNFTHALIGVRIGTTAVASTQMVGATLGVMNAIPLGLCVAGLTLVGQEIGAGNLPGLKRSARETLTLSIYTSVLLGVALAAMSLVEHRLYPNVTQAVISGATLGLLLNGLFYPAMVINLVVGNGILRAGGDARFVLFASLVSVYGVGIPLTLALVFWLKLGLWGVFLGRGAEEVSRSVILLARYRSSRWYQSALEQ